MKLAQLLLMILAVAALGAVLLLVMARNRRLDAKPNEPSLMRRAGAGLWTFLVRWQEHTGWGPLCVAAAILAWCFLGALDRTAAVDLLAPLGMAPVRAVYAFLALGLTLLAVKRSRRKLNDDEQAELWRRIVSGRWNDGAVIVFLAERGYALVVMAMLLHHFRVAA